jgi:hypothetical protein
MFAELGRVDREFTDFLYGLRRGERWEEKAKQTVRSYIDVMRKHRDTLTERDLLNEQNRMGGNVDPVFVCLLRAMCGREMMTPRVWERIRGEWCGIDIPHDLGEIFRIQDDGQFIARFEGYRFYPGDNIKLKALQDLGVVRGLVDECRGWRAKRSH